MSPITFWMLPFFQTPETSPLTVPTSGFGSSMVVLSSSFLQPTNSTAINAVKEHSCFKLTFILNVSLIFSDILIV
ncbi:hypothetical protein D3C78_1354140 [compost metagenome]